MSRSTYERTFRCSSELSVNGAREWCQRQSNRFACQSPFDDDVRAHYNEEDALQRQKIQETTASRINRILFASLKFVDWRQCYFDYGHMKNMGAGEYSATVADWLAGSGAVLAAESATAPSIGRTPDRRFPKLRY